MNSPIFALKIKIMFRGPITFLFLTLLAVPSMAQKENTRFNKGRLAIYWGWNRSMFTPSDIRFTGNDHDFTLYGVKAYDRPTPISADVYLDPGLATIPQTNYGIRYFFQDNWEVSVNFDHMKYVMPQDQVVRIEGYIDSPDSEFNGVYTGEDIKLTEEFLMFEHTDGLNYINTEVSRYHSLLRLHETSNFDMDVNVLAGAGVGIMFPKSNVMLWGTNRRDEFHVAGWGTNLKVGLNLTFYRFFFLQTELKSGYINMNDILTSVNNDYRAAQDFFFTQWNFFFGGYIPLIKPKKE